MPPEPSGPSGPAGSFVPPGPEAGPTSSSSVFRPLRVGTMALDHRLVVPAPRRRRRLAAGLRREFEQHCRHWAGQGRRAACSGSAAARPSCATRSRRASSPPASAPTGPACSGTRTSCPGSGASPTGSTPRAGSLSVQFVLQGGMPLAPSTTLSGYNDHRIPHALDRDEIAWLVREYGESAALAAEAGADAIEMHANHDDLAPVVPLPADQPPHRRLRRQLRAPPPVPARGRRVDPRPRLAADHPRPAALPRRDDRGRVRHRRVPGASWPPSPPRAPSTTSASTSAATGATPSYIPPRLVPRGAVGAAVRAGQGRRPTSRWSTPAASPTPRRPRRSSPPAMPTWSAIARAIDGRPATSWPRRGPTTPTDPSLHRSERVHPPPGGGGPRVRLCRQPPGRAGAGRAAPTRHPAPFDPGHRAADRRARSWPRSRAERGHQVQLWERERPPRRPAGPRRAGPA